MTWVRFDDQASIHRKVAPLDDATYRLWREAIEWSSRNLTDGRVTIEDLPEVSKRATAARAGKLVERTLWHPAGHVCGSEKCPPPGPDGWVIHDYFDYQPSRAKVKAELAAKAERTRQWRTRKGGKGPPRDGAGDASRNTSQDDHVTDTYGVSDASPSPPRPAPKEGGAGGRPAVTAAAAAATGRSGGQSSQKHHRAPLCPDCANPTDSAYHRRVCAGHLATA